MGAGLFAPIGDKPLIHVACGVLCAPGERVLLAQRPAGKIAAGYWEFPGGKIESGEAPRAALDRELHEELGVEVLDARPLLRFRHEYAERSVVLDTWLVTAFAQEPHPREQQELAWVAVSDLVTWPQILPTVGPIAAALALPSHYVFTPPLAEPDFVLRHLGTLPAGALLRLRLLQLAPRDYEHLAAAAIEASGARRLKIIVDRAPEQAVELGAWGWHASSGVLAGLSAAPAGSVHRLASVHSARELHRARSLCFNAAVLGSVLPTRSHPGAAGIGWAGFMRETQGAGLPVYAIGGLGPDDLGAAHAAYAQGVAGISAYW